MCGVFFEGIGGWVGGEQDLVVAIVGTHDLGLLTSELSLVVYVHTWCGNKETGLLLLLISGHVDDEEEGRALTRGLPSTATQSFIHVHRLVWP